MHMYIRISIWITKPSLNQESKTKNRKANASKVFFFANIASGGVSEKKKQAVSVLDSEFNNSRRLLSIELVINAKFLVLVQLFDS